LNTFRVVIAGAEVGIGDQFVALAAHNRADFCVGFVVEKAVNDMRAGAL